VHCPLASHKLTRGRPLQLEANEAEEDSDRPSASARPTAIITTIVHPLGVMVSLLTATIGLYPKCPKCSKSSKCSRTTHAPCGIDVNNKTVLANAVDAHMEPPMMTAAKELESNRLPATTCCSTTHRQGLLLCLLLPLLAQAPSMTIFGVCLRRSSASSSDASAPNSPPRLLCPPRSCPALRR